MKTHVSMLAALSLLVLVGAGCSSTTTTTTTDDTMVDTSTDTSMEGDAMMEDDAAMMEDDSAAMEDTSSAMMYKANDKVYVDLGYGWYEGVVQSECEGGVFVQHRGLSVLCFTSDKIAMDTVPAAADLTVGTQVIADIGKGEMFGGKTIYPYYSAEITAVSGSNYTVKNSSGTEYTVTAEKLRLK